ncbi:MAG TPA: GNAT family N-acetyltransferase [Candidatus Binataceae bacterium]
MASEAHIKVIPVATPAQMKQAHAIRRAVFIEEQHVPEEIELDAADADAFHALALSDGVAVGCGRMVLYQDVPDPPGAQVKIGRMAVAREHRKSGIGREILLFLMNEARARGLRSAVLDAQLTAEGFYLKNGFTAVGEVFEEAGILHRKMTRAL